MLEKLESACRGLSFIILYNEVWYLCNSQNSVDYAAIIYNPISHCLKIIEVYFLPMLLDNCTLPGTHHGYIGTQAKLNSQHFEYCLLCQRENTTLERLTAFQK